MHSQITITNMVYSFIRNKYDTKSNTYQNKNDIDKKLARYMQIL